MHLSTMRRFVLGYGCAAVVGISAGWGMSRVASAAEFAPVGRPTVTGVSGSNHGSAFSMRGTVTGLVPGVTRRLGVHVSNPNNWDIRILAINVVKLDASPSCPAQGNLHVKRYRSARPGAEVYVVPGHGSVVVPLHIALRPRPRQDRDACQDVVFPLRFTGAAVPAAQ